jgi:hypothetical protein
MRAVYSIVEIRDAMCGPDRKDNAPRMTAGCKACLSGHFWQFFGRLSDPNRAKNRRYMARVKPDITVA